MLDNACTSWMAHENALGLSGMCGPNFVLSANPLACPPATSVPNHWQNNRHISSTSFLHQLSPSDTMMHFLQYGPYYSSVHTEATPTRAGGTVIRHLPESHSVRKPIARLPSKHISASRLLRQPTAARSRHTPYPLGPDSTRWGASSVYGHRCQWSDCASPCGEAVAGTKNAIGQHLQAAHGIRLKADKTIQVCHWEKCQKSMRKESIARHILAIHMKDKVHCPSCGSRFARPDSLQRHQRTCLAKGEDASDACKAGGRTPLP